MTMKLTNILTIPSPKENKHILFMKDAAMSLTVLLSLNIAQKKKKY